ncbi:MAG: tyrosine-type recombinase/integrase [Candidatus Omnitrophica bacterium]|nr:tyrosine-type recombinase/integrase [Candidatus Omnitrophota bacterium]
MKYEIVNQFKDAYAVTQPVFKEPLSPDQCVASLNEAVTHLYLANKCDENRPKRQERNRIMVSVRQFARFLELSNAKEVMLHESLFEDFREALQSILKNTKNKPYPNREVMRSIDCIRFLINEYFYKKKLILRKILVRKAYLKYRRFLSLSELTQKLIIEYENDGRFLQVSKKFFEDSAGKEYFRYQIRRKATKLSACNREARISCALTVLFVLGKSGIEEIEKHDLENLLEIYKNKREAAKDYLEAFFSIVGNGIDLGLLKKNPFDNLFLERRSKKSKGDFVPPDKVEKLLDLCKINWNDLKTVRDRCLTCLIYDTGLRASSIAKLQLEDIKELSDGRYQLAIKGEYLKGNKEDKIVYILFQETIPLLKSWIKVVRPKINAVKQNLFVSLEGLSLTVSGVRKIVKDCCRTLGITTFKGKIPSPHTFRHTLPTLNTDPYGKCVAPRLMQQRLGHMDFETFERIYVHNNPLAEMKEYKRLFTKDSEVNILDKISQEDLLRLLNSLSTLKSNSIRGVIEAYERELEKRRLKKLNTEWENTITENRALSILSSFDIDYRSLRLWGLKEECCRVGEEDGRKIYVYEQKKISDLVDKYLSTEEAYKKFRGSRAEFYRRLKKCQKVAIGRKSFVPKDDFVRCLVDDREQYKMRSRNIRKDAIYTNSAA